MAQSPSPLTPRSGNRSTPAPIEHRSPCKSPEKQRFAHQDIENIPLFSPNGPPSSPLVENVDSSPAKPFDSPTKHRSPPTEPLDEYQHVELTEDALRENEGLTKTIRVKEDEIEKRRENAVEDDMASSPGGIPGYAGMDDTAFSAFSAVPNVDMTRFARLGLTPTKNGSSSPTKSQREDPTPRPLSRNTPSRNRQGDELSSPTLRRHHREMSIHDDETTNLLVDFTGHFHPVSERSPTKSSRFSPRKYHNDLASYAAEKRSPTRHGIPPSTPSDSHHLTNLLDFDLPPAPTPRSMPSISARELESMKSAFQSQISSLKAELSGKEAEVGSLKNAMGDAERRVGEAQEQVREERGLKEGLSAEKADWEKREQEMKDVLRSVKEEIMHSDREKDNLMQRATEAETKIMEVESKLAGLQASTASSNKNSATPETNSGGNLNNNTSAEVEAAVTKVAKELHGLYKSKHEAKVTALKKSYADRWEKKLRDLQSQIDDLTKENETLRLGHDATMTGLDPANLLPQAPSPQSQSADPSESQKEQQQQQSNEEVASLHDRLAMQSSTLTSLSHSISTLRADLAASTDLNNTLQSQLDVSRAETADLIAATEELMALSQSALSSSSSTSVENPQYASQPPSGMGESSSSSRSTFSRSVSNGSMNNATGLKTPGFGGGVGGAESRIGGLRAHGGYGYRTGGGGGGGGGGAKSGLLGNIERMGRGSVRGEGH